MSAYSSLKSQASSLLLALALAAAIGAQMFLVHMRGPGSEEALIYCRADATLRDLHVQSYGMYLPKGEFARRMLAFMGGVRADMYWLKAAQYVSRHFNDPGIKLQFLDELYGAMLDADPYWHTAAIIAARLLAAVGRDQESAERLLEQALRYRPGEWRLWYELAGIYLFWPGREEEAGRALRQAARLPGAPRVLGDAAATLYYEAGRFELAQRMTIERIERYRKQYGPDSPPVRMAQHDLQEFTARMFEERYGRAVAEYERRFGQRPLGLDELSRHGLLPAEPLERDPYGRRWLYQPASGSVISEGLAILEGHRMRVLLDEWVRVYRRRTGRFPPDLETAVNAVREEPHAPEAYRLFGRPPVLMPHPILGDWNYEAGTGEILLPAGYSAADIYGESASSAVGKPSNSRASPAM